MSFQPLPFVDGEAAIDGVTVTGVPSVGNVITATGPTSATWQAPSGGGGVNEVWISGANFQGNGSGFESPGGAGNFVSYDFGGGLNRFAVADIAIPSGWLSFSLTYYQSASADANTAHHFIWESTYQLAVSGTVLSPTTVSHPQSFLNTGTNALTIGVATPNITVGGAKILNYLVRSNNASQEISGVVSLLGILLTKVT